MLEANLSLLQRRYFWLARYNLSLWPVLCNLASKLVGLLLWLTTLLCTQHSIACTLVNRAVLPPHSGDHRRAAS